LDEFRLKDYVEHNGFIGFHIKLYVVKCKEMVGILDDE